MTLRPLLTLTFASLCGVATAQSNAQSSCGTSFFPVQADWIWNYRMTSADGKPTTYSEQHLPSAQGYTSVTRQANQESQRQEFRCQDGHYVSANLPTFGKGIEITKATYKGTGLPPAPWKVGQTWESAWLLEGKLGLLRGKGSIEFKSQVVGRETVTVPAGKFDAWKVEGQQRQQGKVAGVPLNAPSATFNAWYAEGIGLIKGEYGRGTKIELISLDKQ